jgi:hypothetical protein
VTSFLTQNLSCKQVRSVSESQREARESFAGLTTLVGIVCGLETAAISTGTGNPRCQPAEELVTVIAAIQGG